MMGGGTQKIEMNKRTGSAVPSPEYEAMKKSMLKQNPMASAEAEIVNDIRFEGAGMALEQSRSPIYGNVNSPGLSQGLMQGTESAGVQGDDNFNQPLAKPTAQTGYLEGGVSSTLMPQAQPEMMGAEAMQKIQGRLRGEPGGLNNRADVFRRGG